MFFNLRFMGSFLSVTARVRGDMFHYPLIPFPRFFERRLKLTQRSSHRIFA
jgi:hypothetical protein